MISLEAQMGPRLGLLRRELEMAESSRRAICAELDRRPPPEFCPEPVSRRFRRVRDAS